jgi:hypothetical protein
MRLAEGVVGKKTASLLRFQIHSLKQSQQPERTRSNMNWRKRLNADNPRCQYEYSTIDAPRHCIRKAVYLLYGACIYEDFIY